MVFLDSDYDDDNVNSSRDYSKSIMPVINKNKQLKEIKDIGIDEQIRIVNESILDGSIKKTIIKQLKKLWRKK